MLLDAAMTFVFLQSVGSTCYVMLTFCKHMLCSSILALDNHVIGRESSRTHCTSGTGERSERAEITSELISFSQISDSSPLRVRVANIDLGEKLLRSLERRRTGALPGSPPH